MFKFSDNCSYAMPAHFGGVQGALKAVTYEEVTTIALSYETDQEMLAQYVPEGFGILRPALTVSYAMNRGVSWMAGGGYKVIAVTVPAVYTRAQPHIEGLYNLVVWESKACPIIGGREQTGIPKVFADIEDHRRLGDRAFTNASYEGASFLRVEFETEQAMTPDELTLLNQQHGKLNMLGWRYIPNMGKPGAALSHATLYPQEATFMAGWVGRGTVHWQRLSWEQHPVQAHIIDALSRLPVKAYLGAMMTTGSAVLRPDEARQLP